MRPTRRRFLRLGALATAAGLAGCPQAPDADATPTDASPTNPPDGTPSDSTATGDGPGTAVPSSVGLETVASGFTSPVAHADLPGDLQYVVDQPGLLYAVDADGRQDEPVLDLRDAIVDVSGYSERGMLGIALHPDFASNRRLYLRYSAPPREGTPENYAHTFVLSEFTASEDGTTVDPSSERTLLEIPEPQANHNAGAIAFGPDDLLYVAVGDGGAGGDQGVGHVSDWYDAVAGGNGQDVEANLLGSILRIDPDGGGDSPYGIPEDNPLVGTTGLDEHYAWGFRNPWRFSFAGEELFVADVGQQRYEEVSIVERGGNYGWNVREGTHCFEAEDCPSEAPDGSPLHDPILEYGHGGDEPNGLAVVGGYLYRGEALPGLRGRYVFSDWQAQGTLFVATRRESGQWPISVVDVEPASQFQNLLAFGRGRDDALYALTSEQPAVSGSTGALQRIVPS